MNTFKRNIHIHSTLYPFLFFLTLVLFFTLAVRPTYAFCGPLFRSITINPSSPTTGDPIEASIDVTLDVKTVKSRFAITVRSHTDGSLILSRSIDSPPNNPFTLNFGPIGLSGDYKFNAVMSVMSGPHIPTQSCDTTFIVTGPPITTGYKCVAADKPCQPCSAGPNCVYSDQGICEASCTGVGLIILNCLNSEIYKREHADQCSCELGEDVQRMCDPVLCVPVGLGPVNCNDPNCRGCNNCADNIAKAVFPGKTATWTALGCIPNEPQAAATIILKFLIGVGSGIAFLVMLRGALLVLTSQGDPEKINQGKDWIASAVFGLLFMLFSTIILSIIGVDILKIPGFKR